MLVKVLALGQGTCVVQSLREGPRQAPLSAEVSVDEFTSDAAGARGWWCAGGWASGRSLGGWMVVEWVGTNNCHANESCMLGRY